MNTLHTEFPGSSVLQASNKSKFKNVDELSNAAQELRRLIPSYQKVSGARAVGKVISLTETNSISFRTFVSGIMGIVKAHPG